MTKNNNNFISDTIKDFIKEKNLHPRFIYENLSDKDIKNQILNDLRNLSGIYLILNKITLDYYIGSASTGRFNSRFTSHLVNLSGSKVIKNAIRKYNISSFAFLILELFEKEVTRENNKELLDLEDFYLKSLLPNYNILTEAGSSFGYKHSEVTRLKMKANYSEERRLAIGNLNKGRKLSNDTIELIRQAAMNKPKIEFSASALENMKKKSKAVVIYNVNGTVYGEFSSAVAAADSIGTSYKTVLRALKNDGSTPFYKRRFIAKYVNK